MIGPGKPPGPIVPTGEKPETRNEKLPAMLVFINSSKTMVSVPGSAGEQRPQLTDRAVQIDAILKGMSVDELRELMHLSAPLAEKTRALIQRWTADPGQQTPAIDAFQGDIFKGLRAKRFSAEDRAYANEVLRVLSGLYGIIRALDGITPYRLEMMYPVAGEGFANLYQFWGRAIADTLPAEGLLVNASSEEFFKVIRPYVDPARVIEPQFLTQSGSAEPTFVVVHAKVARGAFAGWLILNRVSDPADFRGFDDLDYTYDPGTSTLERPVFIKRP
jgi:cytoplasmic iron level regulating protein YaaA (DUF328/UPF0246 family)